MVLDFFIKVTTPHAPQAHAEQMWISLWDGRKDKIIKVLMTPGPSAAWTKTLMDRHQSWLDEREEAALLTTDPFARTRRAAAFARARGAGMGAANAKLRTDFLRRKADGIAQIQRLARNARKRERRATRPARHAARAREREWRRAHAYGVATEADDRDRMEWEHKHSGGANVD